MTNVIMIEQWNFCRSHEFRAVSFDKSGRESSSGVALAWPLPGLVLGSHSQVRTQKALTLSILIRNKKKE